MDRGWFLGGRKRPALDAARKRAMLDLECDSWQGWRAGRFRRPRPAHITSGWTAADDFKNTAILCAMGQAVTDPISAFLDHMRSVGCEPHDASVVMADDKRRRFQLAGDKPKTMNGCYQLRVEADGFACGWCKNWREGQTHSWHIKAGRKASAEEKAAWKAKAVLARQDRDKAEAAAWADAAKRAKAMWVRCDKTGRSGYLDRKGCDANGARFARGLLVVPVYGDAGLMSLQFIAADGSKRFLKDSQLSGGYFPIAAKGEAIDRLVICEGFATGAALRLALGCPVVCAFNAGNLVPVAKAMRIKYPDAEIIIGADNDQWTEINGKRVNPGINWAQQASVGIGGCRVIAPDVPEDDPDRRTDWDDIWRTDGLDAVRVAFERPVVWPEPEGNWEPVFEDHTTPDIFAEVQPLGHNGGKFYFLPRRTGQVVSFGATALGSIQNLLTMAPDQMWQDHFGGKETSDARVALAASKALIATCISIGVFDPDKIRGVGAWLEGSEVVFNTGGRIIHGDNVTDVRSYKPSSRFIYPANVDVMADIPDAMNDRDAWGIVKSCTWLRWADPMAGYYLAGWIVTSILGGVMPWRPHVHISGDRGSGKSTVLDKLVKPLLAGIAIEADGGSTEPGIRRAIMHSSRPVIMDEAEGHTRASREKMAAVMDLVRASSSGGTIRNANDEYRCWASFLMVGINPQINTEADKSRIVVLHLKTDVRENAAAMHEEWLGLVDGILGEGAPGRLVMRLIGCSSALRATIKAMTAAVRKLGVEARFADQHGALLAGVWLLVKRRAPDDDEADAFLDKIGMVSEINAAMNDVHGESWKVLSEILTADHSYDALGVARRSTIAALIETVVDGDETYRNIASLAMSDLGIEVDGEWLRIASSSPKLSKLLRDTPWSGDGWNRHLVTLPGAQEGRRRSFRGLSRRRTVEIPLGIIMDRSDPKPNDEEIQW